jgi:hypothetical protein
MLDLDCLAVCCLMGKEDLLERVDHSGQAVIHIVCKMTLGCKDNPRAAQERVNCPARLSIFYPSSQGLV